jgi:hypothetical protein
MCARAPLISPFRTHLLLTFWPYRWPSCDPSPQTHSSHRTFLVTTMCHMGRQNMHFTGYCLFCYCPRFTSDMRKLSQVWADFVFEQRLFSKTPEQKSRYLFRATSPSSPRYSQARVICRPSIFHTPRGLIRPIVPPISHNNRPWYLLNLNSHLNTAFVTYYHKTSTTHHTADHSNHLSLSKHFLL